MDIPVTIVVTFDYALVEPLGLECVCMYDVQQISYYNIFIQIYADIWYFPSTYWSCRKLTTGFGIAIDDVQTTVSGVPKSLEPCYFKKIPKFGWLYPLLSLILTFFGWTVWIAKSVMGYCMVWFSIYFSWTTWKGTEFLYGIRESLGENIFFMHCLK